ncbi:MAG TPA: hypothetical protein VGQ62_24405 [Chloroflexota bacterium]|jgi:hypothetical protein|nr:hypothetical protein [Chloroflexota bacterium]
MASGLSRSASGGALALALCAALAWLAQFHHFREFGLYEDDYWFISEAMGQDPSYLARRFLTAVTGLPQGRPLGFFLPDLLSFVGDKLGGLSAIYLLGFVVVSLNVFLCFRLLRSRVPLAPAAVGAAVLCLFPADTTKILLTHDFQLQPSLTFALLAALAYVGGRRWLSYPLGAGALLAYESGYLALFALPLFADCWDRRLPRRLVVHWVGLVVVLILAVVARYVAGEGRATSSVGGVGAIVAPFLGSLALGPVRSIAAMFYGPLKAIPTWDIETIIIVALAFVGFAALLWLARRQEHLSEAGGRTAAGPLRVGAAGLAMLVLGYGLAFTHFPPNAVVGRGTSVHLGATLGMAVLAAAIAWLLIQLRPRLAIALLAAYLALAVGYYVTIERDFMRSWQLQRAFWQQVAACCSDLGDGTVLLYQLNPADEPTFIFTNSWADPLVLSQTYAFPKTWANPPRLFSLTQWLDRVEPEGDHLRWWVPAASWDEHWETLPQGNVILLQRAADGSLTRLTGTIDTPAGALQLKPPAAAQSWPPAQLYGPLLGHG